MPDNGFGTKANSADFLLRLYLITPRVGDGGRRCGRDPGRAVHLAARSGPSDPVPDRQRGHARAAADRRRLRHRVRRACPRRQRSGSVRSSGRSCCTSTPPGTVLEAPYEFPDGKSPANPYLAARRGGPRPRQPRLRGHGVVDQRPLSCTRSSKGRSPTIPSCDGDTSTSSTPGPARTPAGPWQYEVDTDNNVIGDAFTVRAGRLLLIERDDFEGPASVTKRLVRDRPAAHRRRRLRPQGVASSTCCRIANPDGIGIAALPGRLRRIGDPFSFPLQSVEVVLQLARRADPGRQRQQLPGQQRAGTGHAGRHGDDPPRPRRVRATRPSDQPLVIGHRGASGYRPEHTLAAYETRHPAVRRLHRARPRRRPADGVLVARHENEIGGTTDVASRPGVRRPSHDEGDRRGQRHGLVHRGLHARRAAHAASRRAHPRPSAGQHRLQRALPRAHPRRGRRPGPPLPHVRRPAGRRLPRDQAPDVLRRASAWRWRTSWYGCSSRTATAAAERRSSSSPSRPATCATLDTVTDLPIVQLDQLLRGAVRPRRRRRPEDLRRPGHAGRPRRDRRVRRRRRALQGRHDPARRRRGT